MIYFLIILFIIKNTEIKILANISTLNTIKNIFNKLKFNINYLVSITYYLAPIADYLSKNNKVDIKLFFLKKNINELTDD